jgi:hypothetical protein
MEYTIVTGQKKEDLIKKVNELILEGWKPQGGICESGTDSSGFFFSQAMIKN